jgi:hypothetical protein
MVKRIAIAVASICGLLFIGIIVLFTIAVITSEGSTACTLPSGRTIAASAGLYVSLETSKDTATIRTLRHTVVVAPTKIIIDGQLLDTIPADTQSVHMRLGWTDYQVVADGVAVGVPTVSTAAQAMPSVR